MNGNLNQWIEDKSSQIINKQDKVLFEEVAGCCQKN